MISDNISKREISSLSEKEFKKRIEKLEKADQITKIESLIYNKRVYSCVYGHGANISPNLFVRWLKSSDKIEIESNSNDLLSAVTDSRSDLIKDLCKKIQLTVYFYSDDVLKSGLTYYISRGNSSTSVNNTIPPSLFKSYDYSRLYEFVASDLKSDISFVTRSMNVHINLVAPEFVMNFKELISSLEKIGYEATYIASSAVPAKLMQMHAESKEK